MNVDTTRMSSKGQVVIPESVRRSLGLEVGAQFTVIGSGDTIVLKLIAAPSRSEIQKVLKEVRSQVRRLGIKPVDVRKAIREVRRRKRGSSSTRTS